jgi:hypothetical protein
MSGPRVRPFVGIGAGVLLCVTVVVAQQVNSDAVIGHLNAILKLYRSTTIEIQNGANPSDVIYQENERSLVGEAVRLAFQAAKAESAAIRSTEKNAAGAATGASGQAPAHRGAAIENR